MDVENPSNDKPTERDAKQGYFKEWTDPTNDKMYMEWKGRPPREEDPEKKYRKLIEGIDKSKVCKPLQLAIRAWLTKTSPQPSPGNGLRKTSKTSALTERPSIQESLREMGAAYQKTHPEKAGVLRRTGKPDLAAQEAGLELFLLWLISTEGAAGGMTYKEIADETLKIAGVKTAGETTPSKLGERVPATNRGMDKKLFDVPPPEPPSSRPYLPPPLIP